MGVIQVATIPPEMTCYQLYM